MNKTNNFGLRQFFEGPYLSEEKKNTTKENIPIPASTVSVLVFCISSKTSKHNSWLSTLKPGGIRKNYYQNSCFRIIQVRVTGQKYYLQVKPISVPTKRANTKTISPKAFMLQGNKHSIAHCEYTRRSTLG